MDFMNTVLIIGSGGREHAILKALLRSDRALCMYAYPGNPGMEKDGCMLVTKKIDNWDELADWAQENQIELTIVGPEVPLTEGVVDSFQKKGLSIFGPSKDAARIEGSKAFSKDLMKKYGIPTADYQLFDSKEKALSYLEKNGVPTVIKVSGLAAGKGAVVCDTMEQAKSTLQQIYDTKEFGSAGQTVVIEEKMTGEEASVFVLTDGINYKILPVSQDHKAIGDRDKGPNTGGMGAYAPAPIVDQQMLSKIEMDIIVPTISAMNQEGCRYKGLLYVGVMITPQGPRVVEYNCRFGDPETQAVLPLVQCDWYEIFKSCSNGTLAKTKWTINSGFCVAVVLASKGYPGPYEKGKRITGIDDAEHSLANLDIYHAGTTIDENDQLLTNGGRVLAVSAWAETLIDAIALSYEGVAEVEFEGKTFRRDIAAKGLARLKNKTTV